MTMLIAAAKDSWACLMEPTSDGEFVCSFVSPSVCPKKYLSKYLIYLISIHSLYKIYMRSDFPHGVTNFLKTKFCLLCLFVC